MWRWLRRGRQHDGADTTAYGNGRDAYAEQPDEPVNRAAWNAPTVLLDRPLLTLGGWCRAGLNQRGTR